LLLLFSLDLNGYCRFLESVEVSKLDSYGGGIGDWDGYFACYVPNGSYTPDEWTFAFGWEF